MLISGQQLSLQEADTYRQIQEGIDNALNKEFLLAGRYATA